MSYLLDTNALIGLLFCPEILSEEANRIIQESDDLSVSIASLWEMGIKQSIGKIDIDVSAVEKTVLFRNTKKLKQSGNSVHEHLISEKVWDVLVSASNNHSSVP